MCVISSCVQTMVWLPVFGIFNVRTDVNACTHTGGGGGGGGLADAARESALKVDSGRNIPCRTGDLNPPQYCALAFQ